MSKNNYRPLKRNPDITEENAKKFADQFSVWPPEKANKYYTQAKLKNLLTNEADTFGVHINSDLVIQTIAAITIPYALSNAYEHYLNVSNYFFYMVEHPTQATALILGQDGLFH